MATDQKLYRNKAGYTATLVSCRWAGAVIEKVNGDIWVGAVKSKHSNVEPTDGWTKLGVLSSQITSIYFENVLLLEKQSYCL